MRADCDPAIGEEHRRPFQSTCEELHHFLSPSAAERGQITHKFFRRTKDIGLPFFAFLDANGDEIVDSLRPVAGKSKPVNIGHPYESEEVDWFLAMVKKAAPDISPQESQTLEDWLRAQKKQSSAPGTGAHPL